MRLSPEALRERRESEQKEQTIRLTEAIAQTIRKQIGPFFEGTHQSEKTTSLSLVTRQIQKAFAEGRGAFYSGGDRSGKTHLLLETFLQLIWKEWEAYHPVNGYPDPFEFIDRTCHYSSSYQLFEQLRKKEKLPLCRYNLIDDFGAEESSPFLIVGLSEYIREIHMRELALVIASPYKRVDLEDTAGYKRMLGRIEEKCDFFELPPVLRSEQEITKNTHSWRC